MTLRDRLDRLRAQPQPPASAPRPERRQPLPDFGQIAPGWEYDGPAGRCHVAEAVFPLNHRHGTFQLAAPFRADRTFLHRLAGGAPGPVDLTRTVFLDTETTGLAGGTGTYPFLIGIGYFAAPAAGADPDRFVVRQFALRDYSEEPAQLEALTEELARFSAVVTYNGRAFDLPLIETRYRMQRHGPPLENPQHLDLLFPARAVWRERLPSCALKDIETAVLGVRRLGDVPGWLIPNLYFDYLRNRDPRPLRPVFSHNLLDILSLATLLARLSHLLADPAALDPADAYGAGRIHESCGDPERAVACYTLALTANLPPVLRQRCLQRLSALHKRAHNWTAALAVWERCMQTADPDLGAHRELAMYYEHVARDHRQALQIVERAILRLDVAALGQRSGAATRRTEWEHRRRRLVLKLGYVR